MKVAETRTVSGRTGCLFNTNNQLQGILKEERLKQRMQHCYRQ
jgi:hypothetical protein